MKLSARNQFAGTVTKINEDALAVIKATSVMVGID